jgi:citrate synthase
LTSFERACYDDPHQLEADPAKLLFWCTLHKTGYESAMIADNRLRFEWKGIVMTTDPAISRGLENVVVASTQLSAIDGTAGRLSYVGYDIHDLSENATYEEVVYLLWNGELPNAAQLEAFKAKLVAERALTDAELEMVRNTPKVGHGMDALRTMVSALGQLDEQAEDVSPEGVDRVAIRITAKIPSLIAAWERLRKGLEPVAADPSLSHAANYLYMVSGEQPNPVYARALDTYLVLLAEHGLNASTFAGRVSIGAQADVYCAVVSAIGTLKGWSHGGANQKAMETFLEIGTAENALPYINNLVETRGRLMGVGHRIYRVEDPRMRPLRKQFLALTAEGGDRMYEVAEEVGRVIQEHPHFVARKLFPNVEFYSAPLLYSLGFPLDLFTAAFAMSRIAGWTGHIREQLADNRLIRPKADYSGPEARAFVAIEDRA